MNSEEQIQPNSELPEGQENAPQIADNNLVQFFQVLIEIDRENSSNSKK